MAAIVDWIVVELVNGVDVNPAIDIDEGVATAATTLFTPVWISTPW